MPERNARHWIVVFGREIRVSRRFQRFWERYAHLIFGGSHTISDYEGEG